jgi:hypothetical protein
LTYLGFVTEGKLSALFIKPSLGVSNWPVIYFINYTPTSSLALFNTAPPVIPLFGRVPGKASGSSRSRVDDGGGLQYVFWKN